MGWSCPFSFFLVPVLLLVKQPDLGSAAFVLVATAVVLFVGGPDFASGCVGMPRSRWGGVDCGEYAGEVGSIGGFHESGSASAGGGYQVTQALIALGSGGIRGVGLGQSIQKMFYLPEAHTDFIFPILGEELGLVATLAVVLVFLMLTLCGGYIAGHASDLSAMALGMGVTALVGMQAVANLGVVTGLLPPKGVGLPLLVMGDRIWFFAWGRWGF